MNPLPGLIAFLCFSLAASFDAAAQPSLVPLVEAPGNIDVRPKMKNMRLKEGDNVVYQQGSTTLIAEARAGKVTNWKATRDGKTLAVQAKKPTKPKRPCIVCPIDASTPPIAEVCYEIACDKLPKKTTRVGGVLKNNLSICAEFYIHATST